MKSLKFLIFLLIFYFSFFTFHFAVAQTEDERMAELRAEIERLEQQAEQFRGNIAQEQAEAKTLQSEIAKLNSQIKYLGNQIFLTGSKITKTGIEIGGVETHISTTQEKINYQKKAISQTILFLNRQETEGLLTLLLKNNNISDFLRQEQYANSLNTNLLALIDDLRGTKKDLEVKKSDLEAKKSDLETLKQQQNSQKISVGGTKSEKDELLKETKGQEAAYQKMLEEVEMKQSLFFTELKELETRIIQGGLYILRIQAENLPKKGTDLFRWPEDNYRITQSYGCTAYARCRRASGPYGGKIHNGMDIKVGYGTPIKAIGDGEIIANGKNDGWGNWIAIKHPPYNLVSIYAHMSAFEFLRVGTQVKAGEIIGYEGSTGFSTGSHLHLSIYKEFFTYINEKNGQLYFNYDNTIDPRDYLY
ncbi:MAG: peptidoglycan DD-metalloendopeptidase family protein [Candidatus Yanofskybacteria bacterium]|nr:peptidoglycan DD-metalloendopeptidase family protein [Candidatus Yanofskybacteria bacterium]